MKLLFILTVSTLVSFLWWICTWIWPSSLNTDPTPVKELLALMGIIYLAAGVATYSKRQSYWSSILLLNCCCTAIHWAGPLGNFGGHYGLLLLMFYLGSGIALFSSTFLHLAFSFPRTRLSFLSAGLVYMPFVLAIVMFVIVLLGFAESELLFVLFPLGSIYGFIAGLIWLYRLWHERYTLLTPISSLLVASTLLLGWVPNMLVETGVLFFGDAGGMTNLTLLLLLVSFCWLAQKTNSE